MKGGTGFRLFDILDADLVAGAAAAERRSARSRFYLVAFVVLTSYFRRVVRPAPLEAAALRRLRRRRGVLLPRRRCADPLLENRPPDYIDAEKVYVEACALLVFAATIWRFNYGKRTARFGRGRLR